MNINLIKISKDITIKQAIKILDQTGKKILVIIEKEKVFGVLTDGDIRRWILKNGNLEESISNIINTKPIILKYNELHKANDIMKKLNIEAIPIVDKDNKFVDIIFWNDILNNKFSKLKTINNPVIIMAGGKGTRLHPYTKVLPKPLIPIGEKTIIERIIENFNQYGCKDFFLTINYKKSMIKAYMEDLDKDYNINYIEEEQFLGTAGSLYLLKGKLQETFFVSNCDVLVDGQYEDILKYHQENRHKITMVTSLKNYTIPYGVIRINNQGCIDAIKEKPEYNFQINTGLYVLEPEVLEDIPENTFFHITDLINMYIEQGEKVGAYPVMENAWMDMGEIKEMQAMIQKLGTDI